MIAVDANVLVYAHRADASFHGEALDAIRVLAEGHTTWALPWPCLHEFYAVVTRVGYFKPASTPDQAMAQIEEWLRSPSVRLLSEGRDHLAWLAELVVPRVIGPLVHDAKIAAICLSHGVSELLTMDRDFSRFPTLRTRSLLA
jgi:toxin-antitoxin system PIN domain toxin